MDSPAVLAVAGWKSPSIQAPWWESHDGDLRRGLQEHSTIVGNTSPPPTDDHDPITADGDLPVVKALSVEHNRRQSRSQCYPWDRDKQVIDSACTICAGGGMICCTGGGIDASCSSCVAGARRGWCAHRWGTLV